jgi:Na+(H+)/acetate symporter ActP
MIPKILLWLVAIFLTVLLSKCILGFFTLLGCISITWIIVICIINMFIGYLIGTILVYIIFEQYKDDIINNLESSFQMHVSADNFHNMNWHYKKTNDEIWEQK